MPTDLSTESLEAFWQWFAASEDDLFHFERDIKPVFDRLATALRRVDDGLTFEFGPVRENGRREFVISAAGIKAAFPAVQALHAAAPDMARWQVVAFRQRRLPLHDVQYDSLEVKSADVHFVMFKDDNPEKTGVMLFLDGYSKEQHNTWGQIGYLFLDQALGEYDVETHLGEIAFAGHSSKYFQHARPLAELPRYFDRRFGRIEA